MTDIRPHLHLVRTRIGRAVLRGGGGTTAHTKELLFRADRNAHTNAIASSARQAIDEQLTRREERRASGAPPLPDALPLMLAVDSKADIEYLRSAFGFEVLADEEGTVFVSTEDLQLTKLEETFKKYLERTKRGEGSAAKLHEVHQADERLVRLLDPELLEKWPAIKDDEIVVVDVSVGCSGISFGKKFPTKFEELPEEKQQEKLQSLGISWDEVYQRWDALRDKRVAELLALVSYYSGKLLGSTIDAPTSGILALPDSAQVRVQVSGLGLRDIVQNFPYLFEVNLPEDIEQSIGGAGQGVDAAHSLAVPPEGAPTVCVMDSGVQEGHRLIQGAIRSGLSRSFLPESNGVSVSDEVPSGGHGTRVAGAVIWGGTPGEGAPVCWIANARILDSTLSLPLALHPPLLARRVVEHYVSQGIRIFSHSVNTRHSKRRRTMSAWAAEFDELAAVYDVLVLQSAGNIPYNSNVSGSPGVKEHLAAGREYPDYFSEKATHIANPAFGLHCVTVGSISKVDLEIGSWRTMAPVDHPSAFSRAGPGMWAGVKPDVVEYAGDYGVQSNPLDVGAPGYLSEAYPALVRATSSSPGPAVDSDTVGTSFAAPKVAHVAAQIAQELSVESGVAYRALLINSARWPAQVEGRVQKSLSNSMDRRTEETDMIRQRALASLGYGVPDAERATGSTDKRTTLYTEGDNYIRAREAHAYQVKLPVELRAIASEAQVLLEVTLAFTARPRRTRRKLGGYLSTWADWETSKKEESIDSFLARVLRNHPTSPNAGELFEWTIGKQDNSGLTADIRRNTGTAQKDWALIRGDELPEDFCIAVLGHPGWDQRPDAKAKYCLCVTLELLGGKVGDLNLYEEIELGLEEIEVGLPLHLSTK